MAVFLTEEMLSGMADTLQYLESRLDETYNFGVSLEEKFDIELVSNASGTDQDLDGWRNLWHVKICKLRSIHKVWSKKSCKADVKVFNGLCGKISDQIAVKMNECLFMQNYCVAKPAPAIGEGEPVVQLPVAADAVATAACPAYSAAAVPVAAAGS